MNKIRNSAATKEPWPRWSLDLVLFFAMATAGVATATYLWKFGGFNSSLSQNHEFWGQFGDYFGGILNPIIAFCTLIVAISVWRLQKNELRETQNALNDQVNATEKNRREQRFFDLMQIYQKTLDTFQETQGGDTKNGKAAFQLWLDQEQPSILISPQPLRGNQDPGKRQAHLDNWIASANDHWRQPSFSGRFDHYFRVVFRLLHDADTLLHDDKYLFMRLFRAQLSRAELTLLGWNLWHGETGSTMRGIASQYGLLKHFPAGDLRTVLERELPSAVFGRKFAARRARSTENEKSPC